MVGSGFIQLLLASLSAGGINANDWMTMVQPAEYFQSRKVVPTVDRMIDFVVADIDSPKAQIKQLAALQYLSEEAEKFKASKNYATNRLAVELVADGKRGLDPAGFGQEYAKRLLLKLDGKKIEAAKAIPLRTDALRWFPADTRLAVAFDMAQLQDIGNDARKGILKNLDDHTRLRLYDQLETVGNVRFDRLSFAVIDAPKFDDQKWLVRISGKATHEWLAKAFVERGGNVKKSKDPDGTPVSILQRTGEAIVLIGNTDMVIVSYNPFNAKHSAAVEDFFAVRAKKKPHAGEGALKDRLAKVPDAAMAFLVGDLPGDIRDDIIKRVIDPAPAKITAYVERGPMGLDLHMETVLKDAGEAAQFTQKAATLRKDGIEQLQKVVKDPPADLPFVPFQSLLKLADSVQIESKGDTVQIKGFVGSYLIHELGRMMVEVENPRNRRPAPAEKK
jgi:hypothetical protein